VSNEAASEDEEIPATKAKPRTRARKAPVVEAAADEKEKEEDK
jgi:hypothetical protein